MIKIELIKDDQPQEWIEYKVEEFVTGEQKELLNDLLVKYIPNFKMEGKNVIKCYTRPEYLSLCSDIIQIINGFKPNTISVSLD